MPSPEQVAAANLTAFIAKVNREEGLYIGDYAALFRFSVEEVERFWQSVWTFCDVIAETRGDTVVENLDQMPGARWFPGARLNVAENLLRRRDDGEALVSWNEDGPQVRMSFGKLYDEVSRVMQALVEAGVQPGDRVAGYMPNIPETVIAAIATAAIGAIWSACSPELGVTAVVDRIGQIAPKVLFTANGYNYGGKAYSIRRKAAEIVKALHGLEVMVVVPYGPPGDGEAIPRAISWDTFLAPHLPQDIAFEQFPFDHPVFILFSSGTTGVPKCIVHGAGGALLVSIKGNVLQFDVKPGDRLFSWTTTGWVVWNFLLFGLGCGATLLLYDGAPFHPSPAMLFDLIADERATFARLTPSYLEALAKAGIAPIRSHDLSALRCITAGSSPLAPAQSAYVYDKIKKDVLLASPVGGTDVFGSLATSNPIGPVWPGEIQARALGMKVEVFDDAGNSLCREPGELVCTLPFPSVPLGFWNDPDGRRFRSTYFDRYPNVWRHGDWAEITPRDGVVIYGRSDSTLNVRGVRIGTAEIYRQIEPVAEITDAVVVAQDRPGGARIVLFVMLREGAQLDDALIERLRGAIRENASPRHVPDLIMQVHDIPRTVTGKVSEYAVGEVIHGRQVRNRDALINPEALAFFREPPV